MTLFCEYGTGFQTKKAGDIINIAWSQGEQPLLAVSARQSGILLFTEKGDPISDDGSKIERKGESSALAWHPKKHILASGWDDGTILVWESSSSRKQILKEDSLVHSGVITLVTWSPDGGYLVSGDQNGKLCVWSNPAGAGLTPIIQYEKGDSAITKCTFRTNPGATATTSGCPPFYYGGDEGVVYMADDKGTCVELIQGDGALHLLTYSPYNQSLFAIMEGQGQFIFRKYYVPTERKVRGEKEFRLQLGERKKDDDNETAAGAAEKLLEKDETRDTVLQTVFVGEGGVGSLISVCQNTRAIRVWGIDVDAFVPGFDLSFLDTESKSKPSKDITLPSSSAPNVLPIASGDGISAISYHPSLRVLAAGSKLGKVHLWKFRGGGKLNRIGSPEDWEYRGAIDSGKAIISLAWGPSGLGIVNLQSVTILKYTTLQAKVAGDNSVVQLSLKKLVIKTKIGPKKEIESAIRVSGLDMNDQYLIVWDGKQAEVWDMTDGKLSAVCSFKTGASAGSLQKNGFYAAVDSKLEICSLQGVVKFTFTFTDREGLPQHVYTASNYLLVATQIGLVKLWDIGAGIDAEPKPVMPGKRFSEIKGNIKSIQVNSNGTKISILAETINEYGQAVPDTQLYLYDIKFDKMHTYQFGPNYYPLLQNWDTREAKLLAVESRKVDTSVSEEKKEERKGVQVAAAEEGESATQDVDSHFHAKLAEAEITILFADSEYGILVQDSFHVDPVRQALVGVNVPHVYIAHRPVEEDDTKVEKRAMIDFVGLETVDEKTRQNLINFSFYLTVGDMTEAYKAVKQATTSKQATSKTSESIWKNMARRCVKTKRLDVALTCLAQLGNAAGARALRRAMKEEEIDAQVGMLAIQLGLLDEAERLYRNCGRYDLLGRLYQVCGRWQDALQMCAKHDRIHLHGTHYNYAKHLESTGEVVKAIKQYEKSIGHEHDIPRFLFDTLSIKEIETIIKGMHDQGLYKWFGQYCESHGQFEDALKYYDMAGETTAAVRVYLELKQEEKAAQTCRVTHDAVACYHLARHYEHSDKPDVEKAIEFYALAKQYHHGIRLAKQHAMDKPLAELAGEGSAETQIDAAKYFEGKGVIDKAVHFYHKGGRLSKAVELCFQAHLFDILREIAEGLDAKTTDAPLLIRVAEFFIEQNQFEKAANLLIAAKQNKRALEVCVANHVAVTEEMAEAMTPPKPETEAERKERIVILSQLAACCKNQGSYNLACRKYTQAGDKINAMRCLLKSGDTEKIIAYASMTKKKELFILAADFLRDLDWHSDPALMETITQFYSKAKALDKLATFFETCAQVEIDDYSAYDKASAALKEALKFLSKSKNFGDRDEKLISLQKKIELVDKFVEARRLTQTAPAEMLRKCNELLMHPDVETAIRVGDVYGTLFEYYYSQRDMPQAFTILQKMRDGGIILDPYVDEDMVDKVHDAVGVPRENRAGAEGEEVAAEDLPTEET